MILTLFTFQMEKINSAFTELTSHLTKTNTDLVELDDTLGKVTKVFVIVGCIFEIN